MLLMLLLMGPMLAMMTMIMAALQCQSDSSACTTVTLREFCEQTKPTKLVIQPTPLGNHHHFSNWILISTLWASSQWNQCTLCSMEPSKDFSHMLFSIQNIGNTALLVSTTYYYYYYLIQVIISYSEIFTFLFIINYVILNIIIYVNMRSC